VDSSSKPKRVTDLEKNEVITDGLIGFYLLLLSCVCVVAASGDLSHTRYPTCVDLNLWSFFDLIEDILCNDM
jgi:hypothetical protein